MSEAVRETSTGTMNLFPEDLAVEIPFLIISVANLAVTLVTQETLNYTVVGEGATVISKCISVMCRV